MTDTVLQSFCERCGTRYTFTEQEEAPGGGRSRLARLGRRSNQDAASEPTISTTLPSSERFEGTFHFCLECRQYTCAKCWNPQEGYCISCRPPGGTAAPGDTSSSAALAAAPTAWPSDDVKKVASAPAPGHGHEHTHPIPQPRPDDAGPSTATPSETQVRPNDGATSEGQGQASKDDGPASGTSDTTAPPDPGKTASPAASDEALKPDPELPWSTAPTSVDEWGRPLADQPTAPEEADVKPEVSHASDGKDAIDPWRGVVFSEEGAPSQGADVAEQAAQRVDFSSSSTDDQFDRAKSDAPQAGSTEEGEPPASGMPAAASAWPKIDGVSKASTQPPGDDAAWPEADHQEDASASERLDSISPTIEDRVDAHDWARSSAAVVSSSGLLEIDGKRAEEPPDDGGTPTDQAAPSVSDMASAAGQAEPEEEQLSAAERILGVAGVTAAATASTLTGEAAQPEQAIAPVLPEAPPAETPEPEPAAAPSAPAVPVDATLTFVDAVLPEPEPAAQAGAAPGPVPSLPDGPQEIEAPVEAVPTPPEVADTAPVPATQRPPVASVEPVEPPAQVPQAAPPPLIPPVAAPGPFAEPYREPTAPQDPPAAPIAATQAESAAPPTPLPQTSASPRPQVPVQAQGPVLAPPAVAAQQPQMPPPLVAPAMPPTQATPADAPSGFVPPPPLPMPTAPPAAKRTGSHACPSCGLPLSAKARFCRRCGAPQASA